MWIQKTISLRARDQGFFLVTDEIERQLPELAQIHIGVAHLFLQHTSAGLTLNENADPSVRADFGYYFGRVVPENDPAYTHTLEGPDDMPAHLKSTLTGVSLTLPVTQGRMNLGTWQGIYLCEFRHHAGARKVIVTLNGESA